MNLPDNGSAIVEPLIYDDYLNFKPLKTAKNWIFQMPHEPTQKNGPLQTPASANDRLNSNT